MLTKISMSEFCKLFQDFKNEAFRLELLPEYEVDEEKEYFKKFKQDTSLSAPIDFNKEWLELIAIKTRQNTHINRVRYIDKNNITDYLLFEIKWGYSENIKAGENIYEINSVNSDVFTKRVPLFQDFWLFDNKTCIIMEYDNSGRFIGISKVDNKYLEDYIGLKNYLIDKSKILDIDQFIGPN